MPKSLVQDMDKCVGCGSCLDICPRNLFVKTEDGKFERNDDLCECIGGSLCRDVCPTGCLSIKEGDTHVCVPKSK